jgi:hypothetical protein
MWAYRDPCVSPKLVVCNYLCKLRAAHCIDDRARRLAVVCGRAPAPFRRPASDLDATPGGSRLGKCPC